VKIAPFAAKLAVWFGNDSKDRIARPMVRPLMAFVREDERVVLGRARLDVQLEGFLRLEHVPAPAHRTRADS
jgi:hypothetical protein